MTDTWTAIRAALGHPDGYLLPWTVAGGCQLVSRPYRDLLTCPARESRWRCEVIGPHTRHRFSDHLVRHERAGDGYSCRSIDTTVPAS